MQREILTENQNLKSIMTWQSQKQLAIPSIMAISAIAVMPAVFMGFPKDKRLDGIEGWCQIEARQVIKSQLSLPPHDRIFLEAGRLQVRALQGTLRFLGTMREACLDSVDSYSWLMSSLQQAYDDLDSDLQGRICKVQPASSGSISPRGNALDTAAVTSEPTASDAAVRPTRSVQKVRMLIMPPIMKLLCAYSPSMWAKKLTRILEDGPFKRADPISLLRAQLILVDLSIRIQITGDVKRLDEHLQKPGPAGSVKVVSDGIKVIQAVIESSTVPANLHGPPDLPQDSGASNGEASDLQIEPVADTTGLLQAAEPRPVHHEQMNVQQISFCGGNVYPDSTSALDGDQNAPTSQHSDTRNAVIQLRYIPWDLQKALIKKHVFLGMDENNAKAESKRLALMLKVRSLLFMALLIIGPDSSKVVAAEGSQAQVPMI